MAQPLLRIFAILWGRCPRYSHLLKSPCFISVFLSFAGLIRVSADLCSMYDRCRVGLSVPFEQTILYGRHICVMMVGSGITCSSHGGGHEERAVKAISQGIFHEKQVR